MSAVLLDVNTLVALGWVEHEAHGVVVKRLARAGKWATCPITQLGFVRLSATSGIFSRTLSPHQAHGALKALCADKQHIFITEHPSVMESNFSQLTGPRQTTDAYLLALAQHHRMRLLTLDQRLSSTFPQAALELLSAESR